MKPIVVPVDFTANAINAAHYAADVALAAQTDIHLLHVFEVPVVPAEAPVGCLFDEMEKNARDLLDSLSADLRERTRRQVTVTAVLEIGSPEFAIREYCNRTTPLLAVMGTPGIRDLPCPVLIVPPGTAFRAIRKIAIACDLTELEQGMPVSLTFLKDLKEMLACHFEVINVTTEKASRRENADFERYEWKEWMRDVVPEVHVIKAATIDEGIRSYLLEHDVDWLILFPKHHGILEFHHSLSKKILLHCPVPVISVHE
ncbi:MAG TPA: universal stress protein [Puia sp.]|nr:universal stress protein [Puia sp.]